MVKLKAITLIILVAVLLVAGLPSFTACGPSAEETRQYNLDMAAQYDAKAKVAEQRYKDIMDAAISEQRLFEYSARQGEPEYGWFYRAEELRDNAYRYYERANEYRQLAEQYRLKASR